MAFDFPDTRTSTAHYASPLEQPVQYTPPPANAALLPGALPALPALPVPVTGGRRASIWVFVAVLFVLFALVSYFLTALGPVASGIGLLVAVVPFAIVFLTVMLIDRWEPEPLSLLIFAVAWGAVVSIAMTLGVDLGMTAVIGERPDVFAAVIQAPIVEEATKGLGLLVVVLIGRRAFDGPIDGIVYGALIGAGFAFTENIQYFAISMLDGGFFALGETFVMRGLMSPFAHAMFTAVMGFTIGLAMRRAGRMRAIVQYALIGYIGSVALHALWNGSATFGDFWALYTTLQIPLFVAFAIGIIALRREETRLTQQRLGEYAAAGWFTPEEVHMLASPAGRKVGLRWAATLSGDRTVLMKQFIADAAALAAVRQRALRGNDRHASADEQALLVRTRATRSALLA